MRPDHSIASLLFILGPPAAGKSTVARGISTALPEAAIFSAGSRWRRLANRRTATGTAIALCLTRNEPIPTQILERTHEAFFRANRRQDLLVIDGTPYSAEQFGAICTAARKIRGNAIRLGAVILSGNLASLRARAQSRGRPDDGADNFDSRLKNYADLQAPLLEVLRNTGGFDAILEIDIGALDATHAVDWIRSEFLKTPASSAASG